MSARQMNIASALIQLTKPIPKELANSATFFFYDPNLSSYRIPSDETLKRSSSFEWDKIINQLFYEGVII